MYANIVHAQTRTQPGISSHLGHVLLTSRSDLPQREPRPIHTSITRLARSRCTELVAGYLVGRMQIVKVFIDCLVDIIVIVLYI